MMGIALVAAGGALGAVARFVVSLACLRMFGPGFPWGTLAANVMGGFLMGLLVGGLDPVSQRKWLLFAGTGMLGGFTTFSAFSIETVQMLERQAFAPAIAYMIGSVLASVAAAGAGWTIARAQA